MDAFEEHAVYSSLCGNPDKTPEQEGEQEVSEEAVDLGDFLSHSLQVRSRLSVGHESFFLFYCYIMKCLLIKKGWGVKIQQSPTHLKKLNEKKCQHLSKPYS